MDTELNVRQIRGERSQAELAQLLGVTQATVSRWETGAQKPDGPAAILLKLLSTDRLPPQAAAE
ncbi:MAG: helix-turn-helix domain-containing protein [Rhodobacteraceae bacterium]|jgi:DNA-binding transcriptional regulator YiaG|nr:helix-turn-helix domain-containing protein [Paracoccaceae bacterium]